MPSRILLPSASKMYEPSARVIIRDRFSYSASWSVNGCRWCSRSSSCQSCLERFSIAAMYCPYIPLDIEHQDLALPRRDDLFELHELGMLERAIQGNELLAEHAPHRAARAQRIDRGKD